MTAAVSPVNSTPCLTTRQNMMIKYCCEKMASLVAKCLELNGLRVSGKKPHLKLSVPDKKFNQRDMALYVSWIQGYSDACQILRSPISLIIQEMDNFHSDYEINDPRRLDCYIRVMDEIKLAFPVTPEDYKRDAADISKILFNERN